MTIENDELKKNEFKKFTKIRQFKDIVRDVKLRHDFVGNNSDGIPEYDHSSEYPTVKFTGTVKLHGTNAALRIWDGKVTPQSRNKDLSVLNDNHGFALFVAGLSESIIRSFVFSRCVVYGEWCGKSVQRRVAVSELSKRFVIFGVRDLVSDEWLDLNAITVPVKLWNENAVFSVTQFETFELNVDFEHPELAQNKLQKITEQVEHECPAGKFFGVKGIGEGVVWSTGFNFSSTTGLVFKVKGEKHSVSKCKTLASVDVEKINTVNEFANMVCTTARLNQGIEFLKSENIPLTRNNTAAFMRWVIQDVCEEEIMQMVAMQLTKKDVQGAISNKCRSFWFDLINAV